MTNLRAVTLGLLASTALAGPALAQTGQSPAPGTNATNVTSPPPKVQQAQDGNRDIAIAAARVMQAEAQSTIQRSALFPQIGGQGDGQRGGCSGQSCQQFRKGNAFSLTFNASYELDFWGLARDNLRAANEQLKAARFAQQSVALTVTANVASQYLTVLAIRRRIAIANENIAHTG